jgi:hypothetical protein
MTQARRAFALPANIFFNRLKAVDVFDIRQYLQPAHKLFPRYNCVESLSITKFPNQSGAGRGGHQLTCSSD